MKRQCVQMDTPLNGVTAQHADQVAHLQEFYTTTSVVAYTFVRIQRSVAWLSDLSKLFSQRRFAYSSSTEINSRNIRRQLQHKNHIWGSLSWTILLSQPNDTPHNAFSHIYLESWFSWVTRKPRKIYRDEQMMSFCVYIWQPPIKCSFWKRCENFGCLVLISPHAMCATH